MYFTPSLLQALVHVYVYDLQALADVSCPGLGELVVRLVALVNYFSPFGWVRSRARDYS